MSANADYLTFLRRKIIEVSMPSLFDGMGLEEVA